MLRSKATVALMKLEEIDRKYKIKGNKDIKSLRYSSLSDISSIDSEDQIRTDHGFGDNGNLITTRTKLDIRMPDTYVTKQRSLEAWKNESGTELLTIFNEFDDTPSRLETIGPQVMVDSGRTEEKRIAELASEANLKIKFSDVLMSEKSKVDMASLISKEFTQIQCQSTVRSSHLVLNKSNTCISEEITVKSVESMIHVEEDAKSILMEDYDDQSNLVASVATYSEDFVKTPSDTLNLEVSVSLEYANKSALTLLDQSKVTPTKDQQRESLLLRTEATVSEVEECDTASGADLNDYNSKSIKLSVNSDRGSKKQRKSQRVSTVNSTRESSVSKSSAFLPDFEKKHDLRRSQSPHTAVLSERDQLRKKKTKVSQNLRHEKASMTANVEEKKKLEKIRTKAGDFPTKDFSVAEKPRQCGSQKNINPDTRTKCSNNSKTEEIVQGKSRGAIANVKNRTRFNLGSVKQEAGLRYHTKDVEMLKREIRRELQLQREKDHLRDRFRCYVVKMMENEQRFMTTGARHRDRDDRNSASGLSRQTDSLHEYFFKPLDLPNVATFKRPDVEDDISYDFGNDRHLHLSVIRERILGIRHWLKQHFVLYKDYSNLVSTMNSEYVPVTLQETKKMICDVQQFYKRERLRHVR